MLARIVDGATLITVVLAASVVTSRYLEGREGTDPARAQAEAEIVALEAELKGRSIPAIDLIPSGSREVRPRSVDFSGDGLQLVMLFRTTCPACELNLPLWEGLLAELPDETRAHAVTMEPATEEFRYFESPRPRVWHAASPPAYIDAFSGFTPTTLVITGAGSVAYARIGVLTAEDVEEILALLGKPGEEVHHAL